MKKINVFCPLLGSGFIDMTSGSYLAQQNRPFPSSPGPLFQNEFRCSAFDMEIVFHSHANKTHFHKKGRAPSLILKVRVFGTRKWPIGSLSNDDGNGNGNENLKSVWRENLRFHSTPCESSLRTTTANCRAIFSVFSFVFATHLRIVTLTHINTIILQNSYRGIGPTVILSEYFVADYF